MAGELAAGGLIESARRVAGAGAEAAEGTAAWLAPRSAERLARRLSGMRGAAMKLGQLLSLESEDILPAEFAEALAVLRTRADAMPRTQVRRVLGREYGRGWETRFAELDLEPVAAASIGQVHFARAHDGSELALKLQYPGVARSIDSDVDNVATLLRMARILPVEVDVSGIVAEAKRQLRQEADYLAEAAHLHRYGELLADEPRLVVPRVHDALTTRRILAMDFARGLPVEELRSPDVPQHERDEVGVLLLRLLFRELFEFRFMQTDPNFGNYLVEPAGGDGPRRVFLLDLGSAREYDAEFAAHYARICRSVIDEDRDAVADALEAIGYLHGDDDPPTVAAVVDLIFLLCEPLQKRGVYDFAHSGLAARGRDAGIDLAFRKGYRRAPPPETVFLHRKIIGTFLLCARIRARVDVRRVVEPFLPPSLG